MKSPTVARRQVPPIGSLSVDDEVEAIDVLTVTPYSVDRSPGFTDQRRHSPSSLSSIDALRWTPGNQRPPRTLAARESVCRTGTQTPTVVAPASSSHSTETRWAAARRSVPTPAGDDAGPRGRADRGEICSWRRRWVISTAAAVLASAHNTRTTARHLRRGTDEVGRAYAKRHRPENPAQPREAFQP